MNIVAIEPLFGTSFFERLKELIEKAKRRILIASAFLHKDVYCELMEVETDLPIYTIVRNDSNFKPYNSIVVPKEFYHGKIYIIDNTIIVGSHNLTKHSIRNEGEFSIMITAESETIDALLFSIFYNIFVRSSKNIQLNYINADTTYLYQWGCPFCGKDTPDPFSIVECPWYGSGDAKYVSKSDCESYDREGSCKGCFAYQHPIDRDLYFCDDRGCGLGIDPTYGKFIKHAINPPSNEYIKKAKRLIEIFNGLCQYISPELSARVLRDLELLGRVLIIDTVDRGVSDYLISLNFFKEMTISFVEDFINSVSKIVKKEIRGQFRNLGIRVE